MNILQSQEKDPVNQSVGSQDSGNTGIEMNNDGKAAYWGRVFTGDVRSIPQDVREKAGIPMPISEDDGFRLAGTVVRSWVVDNLPYSKEQIAADWGGIRKGIANELGTGEDDHEIFLALSERNRVEKQDKELLSQVYARTYDSVAFRGGREYGEGEDEGWKNRLPERLHELAGQMRERAASRAEDDRTRLSPAFEKLQNGVEALVKLEDVKLSEEGEGTAGTAARTYWNSRLDLRALSAAPEIISAVGALNDLNAEDRNKVYRMLVRKARDRGGMGEKALKAVQMGVFDIAYNTAHLGMNVYAQGVNAIGNDLNRLAGISADWAQEHSEKVRNASRIFEELKEYVRTEESPLYDSDTGLAEQILLDGLSSAAPAALAFTGPAGFTVMAGSDIGRSMADSQKMNPDGDYGYQMGASVISGFANSALSAGMTKLGSRVVGTALRTFRAAKGADGAIRSGRAIGEGAFRAIGEMGAMTAENKAQEVVQYAAQEGAAAFGGKESGVPWDNWIERNMDPVMQLKEAAGLFPFLLIAGGKASLRHFRNPQALLKDAASLSKFGIPEETVSRITQEKNPEAGTILIRSAIRENPMWGSIFLGKKAFEWAKILENPDTPMFSSEKEVREFLDMGPERIQKPWEKSHLESLANERDLPLPDQEMNSGIVRERWRMRSGIPESGKGSRFSEALQKWETGERREERLSLGRIRSRDMILPERVRESEVFDPFSEKVKKEFLSSRIEEIARRPYKFLLLRYRDGDAAPSGKKHWDEVTQESSRRMRELIGEQAVRLSSGKSWDEVRNGMSSSWWENWLGERNAGDSVDRRVMEWIGSTVDLIPEERRWAVPLSRDLAGGGLTMKGDERYKMLGRALSEMEIYAAEASDLFRDSLPHEFRALCRLAWGDQADVRLFSALIPHLQEFDVMRGRGFSPGQSFESLLRRHLDLKSNDSASGTPGDVRNPNFSWMKDVMNRLEKVSPGGMESTLGADGKRLWRVRYPNGEFSAWHGGRKEAMNDMASHLSLVYSPLGLSRRSLAGSVLNGDIKDVVVNRIRKGMESITLVDDLAVRATADLVEQGYGRRSYRAPGDEIVIHSGDSSVPLEQIMNQQSISHRKEIYEKYVGFSSGVEAEASNIDIDNAKGLIMNKLELYRKSSPLGMIEDRAEVVWDRLLRTGQLKVAEAWRALSALGRLNEGETANPYGDYVRLSEELSQLSKEWYLGHLDDASVPSSVGMWARYSVARPLPTDSQIAAAMKKASALSLETNAKRKRSDQRVLDQWSEWAITEEIRRLADAANKLPRSINNKNISDKFISMLSDSVGMNRHVRAERFWALSGNSERGVFPMIERYAHSLENGDLLDSLPNHVSKDLVFLLGGSDDFMPKSFDEMEQSARRKLCELADNLKRHQNIDLWNPDENNPGKYLRISEKNYSSFKSGDDGSSSVWERRLEPADVKKPGQVDNDWFMRREESLPEEWRNKPEIERSIDTLGKIRKDFSSRPVPSGDGIYWRGVLIRHDSPVAPCGIPSSWLRDTPLGAGLESIFLLDRSGKSIKGAHYPMIHDWQNALSCYDHCSMFINPLNRGHTIRIMPGMPEAALKEARAPYVVHSWNGIFMDKEGNAVTIDNYKDSYIPLELFGFSDVRPDVPEGSFRLLKERMMKKLLDEISDIELQKKFWWDETTADGGFSEAVIRIYEELGIRRDYELGKLKLTDPLYIESLRFVSHAVNSPKWMAGGFEYGTPSHGVLIQEGGAWKHMVEDRIGRGRNARELIIK